MCEQVKDIHYYRACEDAREDAHYRNIKRTDEEVLKMAQDRRDYEAQNLVKNKR